MGEERSENDEESGAEDGVSKAFVCKMGEERVFEEWILKQKWRERKVTATLNFIFQVRLRQGFVFK